MFEARVTNALNPCMVQKVTKKSHRASIDVWHASKQETRDCATHLEVQCLPPAHCALSEDAVKFLVRNENLELIERVNRLLATEDPALTH